MLICNTAVAKSDVILYIKGFKTMMFYMGLAL